MNSESPSDSYSAPSIPATLTITSFLYFINVAEVSFDRLLSAGLLGPLLVGIIYGPQAADLLSPSVQAVFIQLGYIGLLLIIFEAGLSTNLSLLFGNFWLSLCVALTGVLLPIALSLLLLHFGYGYTPLQSFAAGASLCSTSLGTTLTLLTPPLRRTTVGVVLMSAALLDDIAGLVIAAIISHLSSNTIGIIPWQTIVRPILVSAAFGLGTPLLAWSLRFLAHKIPFHPKLEDKMHMGSVQLFIIVSTLSGFVAGALYAGTSELFGAYLAGAFLTYVLVPPRPDELLPPNRKDSASEAVPTDVLQTPQFHSPQGAFAFYIAPTLRTFFSPLFFASIGTALPVRSLGARQVVWRGIVYALLMVVAKAIVGVWIWVWPKDRCCRRPPAPRTGHATPSPPDAAAPSSPLLLGLAMVARGEIALIVVQLARPLLLGQDGADLEPYAVAIWAILLTTIGGAMGVGCLMRKTR